MAPVQDEATNTTSVIRKALFMKRDSACGVQWGRCVGTLELSVNQADMPAPTLVLPARRQRSPARELVMTACWAREARPAR